jgi:hypothetical protein
MGVFLNISATLTGLRFDVLLVSGLGVVFFGDSLSESELTTSIFCFFSGFFVLVFFCSGVLDITSSSSESINRLGFFLLEGGTFFGGSLPGFFERTVKNERISYKFEVKFATRRNNKQTYSRHDNVYFIVN